ncbi:hypothetical protein [Nevskia ramosa]|uniref:hypothetical protein n=1 Tax=Nevskia ramosa TaxID=64002 RepID=UPI0003B37C43|nr:hypothetical protein [Nevskia ramosa]
MSARVQRSAGLPMLAWLIAGWLAAGSQTAQAVEGVPDSQHAELAAASTALAVAREQRFRQQAAETGSDEAGNTRFDLGISAVNAELESLVLSIDEVALQTVTIAPEDRTALHARGGLLPLAALPLAEGAHRLSVDWTLRGEPPRRSEFAFEIGAGSSERELRLARRQPLAGLSLTLIEWKAGEQRQSPFERWAEALIDEAPRSNGYQPGNPDDPRWRRARHLLARDRPWLAAIALTQLEAASATDPATAALLAEAAARCGLIATADAALARAKSADRNLYSEAVLAVAQRHLAEGQAEAAMQTLDVLPLKLVPAVRNEAVLARARALFALGRADRASQTLQSAEVDPVRLASAPVDERLRAGLIQYDLGLALIASGAVERGRALLDRLGRADARETIEQALRDRANLTLASDFLRAGQGATARPIFERIPLEGPYSNLALLGLGWAALGPQGEKQSATAKGDDAGRGETPKFILKAMQRRRLIDCEDYNRRALAPTELCQRLPPFEQAEVPNDLAGLAAEALIVWQELALRDPRDPAVREAWVAAGRAAARAGRRKEAGEHYDAAVAKLEAALSSNAAAAASSASTVMLAALEPGQALPAETVAGFEVAQGLDAAPTSAALHRLLAEIAELRWLTESSIATGDDGEALAALSARQQALLPSLATATLAAERRQLLAWLAAGRAGIAAVTDPALEHLEAK